MLCPSRHSKNLAVAPVSTPAVRNLITYSGLAVPLSQPYPMGSGPWSPCLGLARCGHTAPGFALGQADLDGHAFKDRLAKPQIQ
jgi:hypothetical protein